MKSYHFCNNCGKNGHLFHSCKKPITSSGIICFTKQHNKLKYLLICRKDSLGYVDFIRGKYPLFNKQYILNLLGEMTDSEKHKIMNNDFKTLWINLWGDFIGTQYTSEEKISSNKFNTIKSGISLYNKDFYNLQDLIAETNSQWNEPEWGFPKGRRNYQENDLICALREFEEETGISQKKLHIIKNVLPYEEIFMGSNFKSYKHKYYLAYIKNPPLTFDNYQKSEVSKINFFDLENTKNLIRNYNCEKIDIIKKIDTILKQYFLLYN